MPHSKGTNNDITPDDGTGVPKRVAVHTHMLTDNNVKRHKTHNKN
jgi:hypothetical protein